MAKADEVLRQPGLLEEDSTPSVPEVPGLLFRPDVISAEEETTLLEAIGALELRPFVFRGIEARRRVAAFGLGYSFNRQSLTDAPPLPAFLQSLAARVAPLARIAPEDIAEALVTEYPVGAGIGWHRDAPPFDVIIGVSLLSSCVFRLRPCVPTGQSRRGQTRPLAMTLPPRSAYVLAGTARTDWEHGIPESVSRRLSITFRTLRRTRTRSDA